MSEKPSLARCFTAPVQDLSADELLALQTYARETTRKLERYMVELGTFLEACEAVSNGVVAELEKFSEAGTDGEPTPPPLRIA